MTYSTHCCIAYHPPPPPTFTLLRCFSDSLPSPLKSKGWLLAVRSVAHYPRQILLLCLYIFILSTAIIVHQENSPWLASRDAWAVQAWRCELRVRAGGGEGSALWTSSPQVLGYSHTFRPGYREKTQGILFLSLKFHPCFKLFCLSQLRRGEGQGEPPPCRDLLRRRGERRRWEPRKPACPSPALRGRRRTDWRKELCFHN